MKRTIEDLTVIIDDLKKQRDDAIERAEKAETDAILKAETDAILTLVKWLRQGVERAIKCKRPHLAATLIDVADALLRDNPHVKEAST